MESTLKGADKHETILEKFRELGRVIETLENLAERIELGSTNKAEATNSEPPTLSLSSALDAIPSKLEDYIVRVTTQVQHIRDLLF